LLCLLPTAAFAAAETREFPQACAAVYPVAVRTMTAAHFEITASDAAGGVLAMKYTGEPLVYHFMVKHANPFLAKYVEGGDRMRNKYRGLTYTKATFTFGATPAGGCQVQPAIGLAVLDLDIQVATRHKDAAWSRTAKDAASNGTAEREFLEQIADAIAK
jgi:hypothetical protein